MSRESSEYCAIAVMAKASIPGRAKTRLTPLLSNEEAAEFNTAFLRDIAQNLLLCRRYAQIEPYMAYAPAGEANFFKAILPSGIGLIETVAPNFGDCLFKGASTLLGNGYQSVCLINSDSPTLPHAYLTTAATVLGAVGDRVVLGPSTDGGYYLIGLKAAHRRLFDDIDWSTERVFDQTVERAREVGLPVAVLPTWYDVDEAESLRVLAGEVLQGRRFRHVGSDQVTATHSRDLLVRLMRTTDLGHRLDFELPIGLVA